MDLSTVKEEQIVVAKDGKTATRYKVVSETIDLDALRKEKEALEAKLAEKEPSEEELVEFGKANHDYYISHDSFEKRLVVISKILGE